MRGFEISRCALSVSLVAALLCACGGSSIPIRATDSASGQADALAHTKTFEYTGKEQTFVVPAGVKHLTVSGHGGEGGGSSAGPSYNYPGFPGRVYAVIRVHPGDKLYVFVGGSGGHGGFNGGGAGGTAGNGSGTGNPGGGASDVRTGGDTLRDRIIVAGGGGGGGGGTIYYESRYESSQGGGGGGGSSYVEPSAIKSRTWTGWKKAKGDGLVVFSWN